LVTERFARVPSIHANEGTHAQAQQAHQAQSPTTEHRGTSPSPRESQERNTMSDVVTVPVQLIVDGQSKDLPIVTATEGNDGIVVSSLLRDTGMVTVDPGFMNTASCESQITYIDGDEGILRYRGYPIEQLAEHSTFLEVAYLLIHGALPTKGELDVVGVLALVVR